MSRAQTGQRHPSMSLIMRSLFAVNYSGGACIRKYRVPMAPVQHSIHVAAFVESCLGIRRSCKGHVRNVASGKLTLRVARLHAQAPEARFCLTSCNKSRSIRSYKTNIPEIFRVCTWGSVPKPNPKETCHRLLGMPHKGSSDRRVC